MKYEPMLAKIADKSILDSSEYWFEPKLDGTRAIIYNKNRKIQIINRRDNNISHRYPELMHLNLDQDCVIDSELVVYNEKGIPDFGLLQQREHLSNLTKIALRAKVLPATLVTFDILNLAGKDLTRIPIEKRKEILNNTIKPTKNLQIIYYTDRGKDLWAEIVARKTEGIIAKKKSSNYYPGSRNNVWYKLKYLKTLDCFIIGYTKEKRNVSSVAVGIFYHDEIKYLGKVGTGFNEELILLLDHELNKIRLNENLTKLPKGILPVIPRIVCEIEFLELSTNLKLRAPSFKGIRKDKFPEQCVLEEQYDR